MLIRIGVSNEKIWVGNTVLPKFCDIFPNYDFLNFTNVGKNLSQIWDEDKKKKGLYLEFVSDFSTFVPKT